MNKYKEIIKEIDSNPRLSVEQDKILNNFFEYLENEGSKKTIVGIKGVKGDGKTRLLNAIIYLYKHLTGDKENIKFDSNNPIAFNSKIIIIDDFDLYNENKQKKLINKNADKVILISYSIIENLYIEPNKEYSLSHKYRLKYLNISDSNVISILRDIEDYSFRTLMTLKDNLDSDIKNSGKINMQNPWLFFQKKFECLYKKEWSNIKKIVINSSETFPKVNEEGLNNSLLKKYHEEYGWLYKKNNSFVFYNEEVLVLLLIRQSEFIENIKSSEILPTLCKKYFKFKLFQKSLINLLISRKIKKTNLIKNKKIYLTSLLNINDIGWVNLENIIFNLDSMYDIFHLFKNKKLLNIISLKEIYNNSFKIIKFWSFDDEDMLHIKNEFKDIYKLIILSFQIINKDSDLRLINHINWKKSL
ncbi:MAG: hypothetical protein HDR43_00585 [Mycoplasma sp.]|nr:hypothetical protein [Mycoplasma sp.]